MSKRELNEYLEQGSSNEFRTDKGNKSMKSRGESYMSASDMSTNRMIQQISIATE